MSLKFSKIDPLNFQDHPKLDYDDDCYYLGEYTARKGFSFSDTNQLIANFKKKPNASSNELYYKRLAIEKAAGLFRAVLANQANAPHFQKATLVPIPPSAIAGDPLYDDRLMRMLKQMKVGLGYKLDIRELVKQVQSVSPAHESEARPTIEEIYDNYCIDEDLTEPEPTEIWIFDDVLTAGCHFKAMQRILTERFPGVETAGFFVARRVPESDLPI